MADGVPRTVQQQASSWKRPVRPIASPAAWLIRRTRSVVSSPPALGAVWGRTVPSAFRGSVRPAGERKVSAAVRTGAVAALAERTVNRSSIRLPSVVRPKKSPVTVRSPGPPPAPAPGDPLGAADASAIAVPVLSPAGADRAPAPPIGATAVAPEAKKTLRGKERRSAWAAGRPRGAAGAAPGGPSGSGSIRSGTTACGAQPRAAVSAPRPSRARNGRRPAPVTARAGGAAGRGSSPTISTRTVAGRAAERSRAAGILVGLFRDGWEHPVEQPWCRLWDTSLRAIRVISPARAPTARRAGIAGGHGRAAGMPRRDPAPGAGQYLCRPRKKLS
ncbi:hypothetical protein GCM10010259_59940 [Streptomyces daghestanicus]|uniref:Uncharacterized protein n=1 Tax=Streptomyces daghestanicus TaxID=66885 RepID=A0ABQ3Q5Z1_9ACTN|nr:hypothetical protein GCM10010259_59940 [Streptomyces daghestanicus]GHI32686.1 hypothetical protein Sdagh_44160 [Streptomyces daghestanicus]